MENKVWDYIDSLIDQFEDINDKETRYETQKIKPFRMSIELNTYTQIQLGFGNK